LGVLIVGALGLVISGCSLNKVTERSRISFSGGDIEFILTSVGSAMDGEKYELKFKNNGKTQTFFTGWNFSEFHAVERNGKFAIQMCRGQIDHAEPIAIGNPENMKLVRLDLSWNCLDKSHEA
jgi:hypothetical protein